MNIQKPRGTQDYLGEEFDKRRKLENEFVDFFVAKGYQGIETPIFEERNLFVRTVGDQTDIVQKELFDLEKKSDEIFSLRPEFTAGVIRSLIEFGIKSMPLPVKVVSVGPCFRYERPQKGRKRQFNQLDSELIGKRSSEIDAQYICDQVEFLSKIGLEDLVLVINCFGSPDSRKRYAEKLGDYLKGASSLCELCKARLNRNPLRALDCKNAECRATVSRGPKITEFLSDEEKAVFDETVAHIQEKTKNAEIIIDPLLVRGLDYYTGIVFELNLKGDESRLNSIGGGGRYDNLIKELGGPDLPAIGCGLGFERIIENLK